MGRLTGFRNLVEVRINASLLLDREDESADVVAQVNSNILSLSGEYYRA